MQNIRLSQQIPNIQASFWINASAGTGKTSILVKRVLALLLNKVAVEKILCITFTKAAAVEMKTRINDELAKWVFLDNDQLSLEIEKLSGRKPGDSLLLYARRLFAIILENENSFRIQTIHSFCKTIIQKFSLEIGLSANFTLQTENDILELLDKVKSQIYKLADTDKNIQEALHTIIAYSSEFSLSQILEELITNKDKFVELTANNNIEILIQSLYTKFDIETNDINKITTEFLKEELDYNSIIPLLANGSVTEQKIAVYLTRWRSYTLEQKLNDIENYLNIFLTQTRELKRKIITDKLAGEFPLVASQFLNKQQAVKIFHEQIITIKFVELSKAILVFSHSIITELYNQKNKLDAIDYDDLITLTRNLLANSTFKDWILYKLDYEIDHILVDEAQDTSPKQWQIIESLTTEFFSGEGAKNCARSLFVVGDEKQSIYSFQGADHHYFYKSYNQFKTLIRNAGKEFYEFDLTTSYRSSYIILQLVDKIFNQQSLKAKICSGDKLLVHDCYKLDVPGIIELWPLVTSEHKSEHRDVNEVVAYQIALKIKNLLCLESPLGEKINPKDIMILVRRRTSLIKEIVKSLKQFNIPTTGLDRINLIDEIVIEDLIAAANFALLAEDDLNLACLLKSPLIAINEEELVELCNKQENISLWQNIRILAFENNKYRKLYEKLVAIYSLNNKAPYDFFCYILYNLNGYKHLIARLGVEAQDLIDEFLATVLEYQKNHVKTLQGFVKWFSQTNNEVRKTLSVEEDKVRILTVHGAKGLQAPIVILPDTTTLPLSNLSNKFLFEEDFICWFGNSKYQNEYLKNAKIQKQQQEINEYIRLLYVALTRAEKYLIIAGYSNKKNIDEECWYKIIANAICGLEYQELTNWVYYQDASKIENGKILKLISGKTILPTYSTNKAMSSVKIPNYMNKEIVQNEIKLTYFSPSNIVNMEVMIESPYTPDFLSSYRKKGILIHKLLELLINIKADQQESFINKFIERYNIDAELALMTKTNCLAILKNYPEIFLANMLAEVKVGGKVTFKEKELILYGQIDRILISEELISIYDFKSTIFVPQDINEIKLQYLLQIYLYRRILNSIFNKDVFSALIWTQVPNIMEITEEEMNKYFDNIEVM